MKLKRLQNKIITVLLFMLIFTNGTIFAGSATIKNSGSSDYKKIRLSQEICQNANIDLSDIIIKNQDGVETPYFIHSNNKVNSTVDNTYPLTLINTYIKENFYYFDYKVETQQDFDLLATSINFTSMDNNFVKSIELYGSYDNLHWEKIMDDKLYHVDGHIDMDITFIKPQKFTHYRIKIPNHLEQINFHNVSLEYSQTSTKQQYFEEVCEPKYTIEEQEKKTYINIEELANLRIHSIDIETDSMFQRDVSVKTTNQTQELYHLTFDGSTYTNTTFNINDTKMDTEITTLIIHNNDDIPIDIAGITVTYYADELVFAGNSDDIYTLEFTQADISSAPIYDIKLYQDEILKGDIDLLSIESIQFDNAVIKEDIVDYKVIYNILIICITIILGIFILVKLTKKPNTKENN